MRFQKVYVEISNLCNLSCAFCPGTKRQKRAMTEDEFTALLPKLRPYTDYLYFHLMGEPLCHPKLGVFLQAAYAHFPNLLLRDKTTPPLDIWGSENEDTLEGMYFQMLVKLFWK